MSYPKPLGGEDLFASYGVNYGEIPLDAYDNKNEDACRVAQLLDEHVHFAKEFPEHPAGIKGVRLSSQ